MTLTAQLKALANDSVNRHPGIAQDLMKDAIDELKQSSIIENAYKTGDTLPKIELPNATGKQINIQDILATGKKVILTFYRGGWCPYCNLELKALQNHLSEFEAKNAKLIAISPEAPDSSLSTTEKNNLSFQVLSDKNNEVAKSLNLVFKLPDYLQNLYKKFGIKLDDNQQNTNQELPIAATYVVDTNGKIIFHYLEEDYKLRADPEEILKVL